MRQVLLKRLSLLGWGVVALWFGFAVHVFAGSTTRCDPSIPADVCNDGNPLFAVVAMGVVFALPAALALMLPYGMARRRQVAGR